MTADDLTPEEVYGACMGHALDRLGSASRFQQAALNGAGADHVDAAVLQLRKALEAIAFAAIAPDRAGFASLRLGKEKLGDYRRDWNARKIFETLHSLNPHPFPVPLLGGVRTEAHHVHFDRRESGFLSWKKFMRTYDRLGKHLHADNPWGPDKHIQNIALDMPRLIAETRGLIELHARFIAKPEPGAVWIVEATDSRVLVTIAVSDGPFAVAP